MRKRILFIVSILTFIAIIVYIFRPIPLDKDFFDTDEITVSYVMNSMKDGEIKPEVKTLTFDSNTTEFHQIRNIFKRYSYHKCFKTWINNGKISTRGMSYQLSTDDTIILITEDSYVMIDDMIYRVDYLGNSKAQKMIKEIKVVLEE